VPLYTARQVLEMNDDEMEAVYHADWDYLDAVKPPGVPPKSVPEVVLSKIVLTDSAKNIANMQTRYLRQFQRHGLWKKWKMVLRYRTLCEKWGLGAVELKCDERQVPAIVGCGRVFVPLILTFEW